jgi:FMN phosphatase YigB (HAD superfamily)
VRAASERDTRPTYTTRRYIFSNGPESSVSKILSLLGVLDLFEKPLMGATFQGPGVCKPERAAFLKVLDCIGICHDDKAAMRDGGWFEDSLKNAKAGKELGFQTCFVKCQHTLEGEGKGGVDEAELEGFDVVVGSVKEELLVKRPDLKVP